MLSCEQYCKISIVTVTLTDVPALDGNQNNPLEVILNYTHLFHSTFAARYPVKQHKAPNHNGIPLTYKLIFWKGEV